MKQGALRKERELKSVGTPEDSESFGYVLPVDDSLM